MNTKNSFTGRGGWKVATTGRQECLPCTEAASGFTLLELLVVFSIIGLLAAVAVPQLRKWQPNVAAGATRQLLDAVSRARQLAISQRTTVYMVFVPPGTTGWFWNDAQYGKGWTSNDLNAATNLFEKQLIGFNFVALHTLGDQPGSPSPRYLSTWQTLPEGTYIPPEKFLARNYPVQPVMTLYTNTKPAYVVYGFFATNDIPFPTDTTPSAQAGQPVYINLPFIAFNYLGQLVGPDGKPTQVNELIPVAQGATIFTRDPATGSGISNRVSVTEIPAGSTATNFNVVVIDWLTGRARVERPQVQ